MDYAKSLSLRLAAPVSKCVSASASMTQQLLSSPAPRPRPYRVCNWDRSLRKGIMAHSLAELLRQAQSALLAPGPLSLVLDEDGTVVETEAFFRTLEEGTVLMALSKGQAWTPSKTPGYQLGLSRKPPRRIDVACVTFDLPTVHVLLGPSCYMQPLLDATEEPKEVEGSPPLQSLLPCSLPPLPRRKTLE
ncbi:PREDICTED: cell death activator CIDE-3-like [Eurypyga helias]|uniref:cell death activator CIDE-3-like n=1 Tax=Eurypyga helias TaxID=54383 RepID=UPI000528BB34|nr:PREDICTED: cell death activator CIDE-3-like [Eurypyga helias]